VRVLSLRILGRRPAGRIGFDERTGDVCTPACRAATRRDRDIDRSLARRGPR
jgi:hypothetical protein